MASVRDDATVDGVDRHGRRRRQRARRRRLRPHRLCPRGRADAGRAACALRRRARVGAHRDDPRRGQASMNWRNGHLRTGRGRARRYDAPLCIVTSRSSGPAMSASRSPRSLPMPDDRSLLRRREPRARRPAEPRRELRQDVPSEKLKQLVDERGLRATTDYDELREADAILIALPTPLSKQREPDLSIVRAATEQSATRLRKGHLVVLESTTYPGTTRDEVQPILERGSGLAAGVDFHLAFSPERVDPGRIDHTTKTVPKVVGGINEACDRSRGGAVRQRHRQRPPRLDPRGGGADQAAREHLPLGQHRARQRAASSRDRMGIDVWEVIDAAATKPFGFMPLRARARASAATASRSIPSTSPGRRASSISRRGSSSWPAR